MIYKGQFKNIDNQLISVYIGTSGADIQDIGEQEITTLLLADNPVIITSASDGIFAPIKADSCTIRILTEKIYPDIYSNTAQGTSVMVKNEDTGVTLFFGYVTPNIYTQEYVGLDELEIEAISALSSLEYLRFSRSGNSFSSWYDIIKVCLQKTGYYKYFYFPDNFNYENTEALAQPLLKVLYQFENNFFDDDQESTPWTYKEILLEFCKFLGVSLVVYKSQLYFIDYGYTDNKYFKYDLTDDSVTEVILENLYTITAESYKTTGATLSYDETYNKIMVKDNLLEFDDVIPSIMDNLINQAEDSNQYYESSITMDEVEYTVLNAFFKSTQWYHNQPSTLPPEARKRNIGSYWQKVAEYEKEKEPSALNWKTYFTMYVQSQYSNSGGCNYLMTYPYKDVDLICNGGYFIINMDYKLSSDYRANDVLKTDDKTYSTASDLSYKDTLFPCRLYVGDYYFDGEKWEHKSEYERKLNKGYYADSSSVYETYDKSNPMWYKYKDTDGDWVFTNKEEWEAATTEKASGSYDSWQHIFYKMTGDEMTYIDETYYHECILKDRFYLVHINEDGDKIFDEMKSLTNTVSWRMNIADSRDGVAIRLPDFILNGKLTFQLYGSNELGTYPVYSTELRPDPERQSDICRAVHISNLELLYKASDSDVSIFNSSTNKGDAIYTNVINDEYVNEWDELEIKITTQIENRITSYSSLLLKETTDANVTFCYKLMDKTLGEYRIQECNLVEKYYNHYKEPKAILDVCLQNVLQPYSRITEMNLGKTFTFDSYELDVKADTLNVKLIEY